MWRTIKGIDGRAKCDAENEVITFNGISCSMSKQLATKFNQQFNSSREIQVVTRETIGEAKTFTADRVMKAIKSCRNSKAFDHRQAQHLPLEASRT